MTAPSGSPCVGQELVLRSAAFLYKVISMTNHDSTRTALTAKKPYATPVLRVYGKIGEITQTSGGGLIRDSVGGGFNKSA
jgi:hypothetical protein